MERPPTCGFDGGVAVVGERLVGLLIPGVDQESGVYALAALRGAAAAVGAGESALGGQRGCAALVAATHHQEDGYRQ